uniref:Retrotransposon gag domain-containing protein n=1 Tax=Rhodnius prolixus TaxID=13249 RepID=T1IAR0_RHOPR
MSSLNGIQQLNMSGNLAANWQFWRQKFENYLQATEINKKPEVTQCAQLLHLIGNEGIRIYNTFNFEATEKDKINSLLNKFENYFMPKKNLEYERYKFFSRKQIEGESIEQYTTDLKNKALSCEFQLLKDDLIKSIFICGVNSDNLRERLLELENKSLDETIKFAQTIDISREQSKLIKLGKAEKEIELDYVRKEYKH